MPGRVSLCEWGLLCLCVGVCVWSRTLGAASSMPKKGPPGGNSKADAARARKAAVAEAKKLLAEHAAEDAKWADEGPKKTKAMQKRMQSEESKAQAAERKAEDKALARKEADEIASSLKAGGGKKKGGGKGGGQPKMTVAMIAQAKADREKREAKLRAKREKAASKVVDEAEYANLVDKQNRNLEVDDEASARSIEEALAVVGGDTARIQAIAASSGSLRDQNQAAKGKMTYKLFESTRLPQLKEEKPGLLGGQYRDLARKEWKRSPMNPNNQ